MKTISIGIPAYNEQANIKNLLDSIFAQKQEGFEISEVIVISDASTDQTDEIVKKYNNPLVRLISKTERKGKALIQNELLKAMQGDIFILFDGDVKLASDDTVYWLIQPIISNSKVGIVSGMYIPTQSENFFQKCLNTGVRIKERAFAHYRQGDNEYLCAGRMRAFSKEFAKIIVWPETVSEDTYSYLFCKYKGFNFVYEGRAKIFFKNPNNYAEHKRQSDRFRGSIGEMKKFFPKDFVEENYNWPFRILFDSYVYYFFKSPLSVIGYNAVFFRTLFSRIDQSHVSSKWAVAETSKQL
jgi:cellulose synthase/poly-beta-1,6-N-acetylglucosamine synthase-like glycosyltransferase